MLQMYAQCKIPTSRGKAKEKTVKVSEKERAKEAERETAFIALTRLISWATRSSPGEDSSHGINSHGSSSQRGEAMMIGLVHGTEVEIKDLQRMVFE